MSYGRLPKIKRLFPIITYKFKGKEDYGTIFSQIFLISIYKNLPLQTIQKIQASELNRAPDGSLSSCYTGKLQVAKKWCNDMILGFNVLRSVVMRMLYNIAVILVTIER